MKHHGRRALIGNIILLLASIVWGFAFVAQKDAASHLDHFSVNMFRFLIGGIVLIPACIVADAIRKNGRRLFSPKNKNFFGINRAELIGGSLCGVFLCLASNLQQLSMNQTSPGKAAFLTALYSIIVPIFALFRGKRVKVNAWIAVGVAVVGAYLLTMYGTEGGFGISPIEIVLLSCSVLFAVHITIIDIFADKVDGIRLSIIQFFVAGLLSAPFALAQGALTADSFVKGLPALLFLGLLSCGVGYTFQIIGQQLSDNPTVVSIILSLESVFGALGGVLFGMEPAMTIPQLIGCALILSAVALSQINFGKKQPPEEPPADPN